jgi:glycerol-3-phosphate O-acyltransferase
VVSVPSIAATVLLSNRYPAIRTPDFLRAARILLDHAEREGARFTDSLAEDRETFEDTLAFLERSGLVVRIKDGEGGILHVPDDKRINLDFYKNNSIHSFVVLALLSHGLLRGLGGEGLRDEVWRWLELFRNEFVLPERESLPHQVATLLERMRDLATTREGRVEWEHPALSLAASILQNFREAYWIAAKALGSLEPAGKSEKALLEEMRRAYRANLLLGVLRKPEGNTTVTLQNALSRLQELGYASFENRGRGGRERWVKPGPLYADLAGVERRLVESVTIPAPRI